MAPLTVIVVAQGASPEQLSRALESARAQEGLDAQLLVAGCAQREVPDSAGCDFVDAPNASPAGLRNAALAAAKSDLVCVIEAHEWLEPGSLLRHLETLRDQPDLVASYGRVAVHGDGRVRVRPEHGKGGHLLRRILHEKHLIAASAALVWRRSALQDAPYPEHLTRAPALRLAIGLGLVQRGPIEFHTSVTANRDPEEIELTTLEEFVRVICTVIYDPSLDDEKIEQRARVRLARYLVAIGKLHYRAEDYPRAGRFFGEAVKAAPGYFKGRRYQFLNFIKTTLNKDPA